MRIAPADAWGHPVDLRLTLDGGQTFTWWERGLPGRSAWEGLLGGQAVYLEVDPTLPPGAVVGEEATSQPVVFPSQLVASPAQPGASPSEPRAAGAEPVAATSGPVAAAVRELLDLRRDYRPLQARLAREDPHLARAIAATPGLRIVRLAPWEALLSFLLATHTHIPRIKTMLAALVRRLGPRGSGLPDPAALARAGEQRLRALGLGYRARYVHRTACRLAEQPELLQRWAQLPTPELREQLMGLPGVGRKVADCVLLFGYGRWDVFPVDRWVRRAVEALYFEGQPVPASRIDREMQARFGELAALAQAHLFAYWRQLGRRSAQAGRDAAR